MVFFKVPYVSLKLPFVKATDDELIPLCANLTHIA